MNLRNFAEVYRAATEVAVRGESLIFEGDGKTIAVRPAIFAAKKMLEVTELHVSAEKRVPRCVDFFTFNNEEFAGLHIAPQFKILLESGGRRYGS